MPIQNTSNFFIKPTFEEKSMYKNTAIKSN